MTSVTVVARTSVTAPGKVLGQEAGGDALERGGRAGAADAVCDAGVRQERAFGGAVPGVWNFSTDGLSMAAAVRADAQFARFARTEPAATAQSAKNSRSAGAAGRSEERRVGKEAGCRGVGR